MKLNLGCGDRYVPGWVNVDWPGSPHPRDVTADLTRELPWGLCTIAAAYAGHLLEHLTPGACLALLERLLPCMVPGGDIMIVGPDIDRAEAMIEAGTFQPTHTLQELKYGGHRWHGDAHLWDCNTPAVMGLLTKAGWADVTDVGITRVEQHWPVADRLPLWQLAVRGTAP